MSKPHVICLIRNELAHLGRKQEWLAEAAKIPPSTLSRIISGHRNPRVTAAKRIARQLGVSIEVLWPDTAPKRRK